MLLYVAYLWVLLLYQVKSDPISEATWRNMDNEEIDVRKHCNNEVCVTKCCQLGEIIGSEMNEYKCITKENVTDQTNQQMEINWISESEKFIKTKKNEKSKIIYVRNDVLSDESRTTTIVWCPANILQNGTIMSTPDDSCPIPEEPLNFCVDFHITEQNTSSGLELNIVFVYRIYTESDPHGNTKQIFIAVAMLISSFFMLLVLVVYCVTPKLQNIEGMVLMAYLLTQIIAFLMKATQNIELTIRRMTPEQCLTRTSAIYFFIIASFFWLNVMSFDLWWTIRGNLQCRKIHRQGELMKFFWYCLYAWGIPMLLTVTGFMADQQQWIAEDSQYKLPFSNCFSEPYPVGIYVHIPIGLLVAANWVLFLMTAYNVWLTKKGVNNIKESRNSKNGGYRFAIYFKLLIFMGANWVLELVPDMTLAPYIIVNSFTMFTGIVIFYIFVCKREVIGTLSKRFSVQASLYFKSDTMKSLAAKRARQSCRNETTEATELSSFVAEPA